MNEGRSPEIYEKMDELFSYALTIVKQYTKSQILEDCFFQIVKSTFFANLIWNFFNNLNSEKLKEMNVSIEEINNLKTKYQNIQTEISTALKTPMILSKIDEKYYLDFKTDVKEQFPKFLRIIDEIENKIDMNKATKVLDEKRKELAQPTQTEVDPDIFIVTKVLEKYIQSNKKFPTPEELAEYTKVGSEEVMRSITQSTFQSMKKNVSDLLKDQREYQVGFEDRLYQRWKNPIDLLELMIRMSSEGGAKKKNLLLSKKPDKILSEKHSALIKIHARALLISNEILTLIRHGYADGANARWRSLHELAVISFFLRENTDEVSRRFLDHDIIKKFRESTDYEKHYERLKFDPPEKEQLKLVKSERDRLIKKYGSEFEKDYGWIPTEILKNPNFKNLEAIVKLDQFRVLYNVSSNAIHGGPRGFYHFGLIDNQQNKVLLAGATNYGLADPIQNTAISLMHVTSSLMLVDFDSESILVAYLMMEFVEDISSSAVEIQEQLKQEEITKSGDDSPSGFIIK